MSQNEHSFRIVSMVPSWTEMLLSMNIHLVGRTRFCIEPKPDVHQIPTVGGTKNWDLDLVHSLTPDLTLLDKDENPKSMSEGHTLTIAATHVRDIPSCIAGIELIAKAITPALPHTTAAFNDILRRWHRIAHAKPIAFMDFDLDKLPGLLHWIKKPTAPVTSIYYVIWRNPWMHATRDTFIGDIAHTLGLSLATQCVDSHYPTLDLNTVDVESSLLLFSSEPYPFHKKKDDLNSLPFSSAIVDGQKFSWFGTRSLAFLESLI